MLRKWKDKASLPVVTILGFVVLGFLLVGSRSGSCEDQTGAARPTSTQGGVELVISMDKSVYVADQPMKVELRFKNNTLEMLQLAPPWHQTLFFERKHRQTNRVGGFNFRLLDAFGRPSREEVISLAAGETYATTWLLHKKIYWMPLVPGDYELRAIYKNPKERWDGVPVWTGEVSSNIVVFRLNDPK